MKKVLFTFIAALLTCSSLWAADEVAPTYMFPEGTFFTGYNNKGGLLAPYFFMPGAETYVFTTNEAGAWQAGDVTATDVNSFDAKYVFGYSGNSGNPIPTVTIGETSYQYGSGSSTEGSKVARVASPNFNLMTSGMTFAAGKSATMVAKIAGVTDYYVYMPNKAGQVMRVKSVSIPITTNNNGDDKTTKALFPDESAHMCVQLFNASFTRNADWTTTKAKGSKELTPKYTATIANFTPNSDSKQYVGSINVVFEDIVDIVGPFVVVLSDFESMGAETRLFCDKAQSNTTQYHKGGKFYQTTSGYLVSVDAMFPGVLNAGKTEFQFAAKEGKDTIAFYTNKKPEDLKIQVPEWLTYTVAYQEDKFNVSSQVYLCLEAAENTVDLVRNGEIIIDNYGMKLNYAVQQEAAAPAPDPVITFVSPVGAERSITVGLNAAGTVGVDWGDGVITEQTTTQAYDGWDGSVSFTGTPAGEGIVKIYADGLIYLGANGKFNEDKSDIPNGITSIDLTKAVDLEELLLNVNKLDNIDLSQNAKLTSLNIANNMFSDIDLSANTALTSLTANNNNFETLDISKNTALTTLYINANKFKAVDFTANTVLKSIYAQENEIESVVIGPNEAKGHTMNFSNNKLTSFSLADAANITTSYIYLRNNQLADSSVVLPTAVKRMWLDGNNFTLAGLYAYKAMATQTFTYATTFATEFAQAPLAITSEEGVIDLSAQAKLGESATAFTWITAANDTLVEGTDYTVVDGVFTFMTSNDSIRCYMTNAELPNFTDKVPYVTTWTSVEAVLVPVITMTGTVGAERTISVGTKTVGDKVMLDWGDGNVIEQTITTDMWDEPAPAEFTGTPAGEGAIKIYGDAITYIEAVGRLTDGDIPNAITSIDVTKATALQELYLNMNKLSSIDLSQNTALKTLNIASNLFETIDLSANAELTSLTADANNLTSINLSKNPAITTVVLSNNQIAELDFSNNPLLKTATCLNNVLTSVNLGKNTAKNHTLQFGGNKLASISLEGLENFSGTYLRLRDNFFASAESIKLPGKIKQLWVDGNALNLVELYALKSKATTLTYATAGMFTSEFAQVPFALDETYPADAPVDLSSQAMLGEAATTFVWKNAAGDVLVEDVDYTVENGVFTFITANDSIRCYLSNAELANFTDAVPYVTTWISVQHATGIKNVNTTDMMNSNAIYNLNGVRVNKDYNGIIIRNGKRFINKK